MSVGTHVAGGQTINLNCYYGKAISPRQRCKLMCVPPLRLLQGTILEIVVQCPHAGGCLLCAAVQQNNHSQEDNSHENF